MVTLFLDLLQIKDTSLESVKTLNMCSRLIAVCREVSKGAKIKNRYNQVAQKEIVHTILRIGIIRVLNESTGRLFRAATQHRQNISDNQSK